MLDAFRLGQSTTLPPRWASVGGGSLSSHHESNLPPSDWWFASTQFVKGKFEQLKQARDTKGGASTSHAATAASQVAPPLSTTFTVYFPKLDYTAAS
ncbi:hypothetical protein H310_06742 [Aphanomyces invadans]|uniref:Uncharacterized protein n=1 Tax=Aphanomyces invadans TaxID=157072 RepID=A0A024U687_9STRA|nr:hypothetical protein H310_06742 [Aphanomyces invadans]ETW01133.1 hypothetical protein H310_06742 [Aphanomyces invadans]|eukprot:XP_008870131.1 hypothetical protein H310_06742 [Aphanomyces invadans]